MKNPYKKELATTNIRIRPSTHKALRHYAEKHGFTVDGAIMNAISGFR